MTFEDQIKRWLLYAIVVLATQILQSYFHEWIGFQAPLRRPMSWSQLYDLPSFIRGIAFALLVLKS